MYMYPYVSLSCAQEQSSAEGGRRGGWPSQTPARGNWPQPWDQTCQTWPCWHGWRRWAQHSFLMEAPARQYHMVISHIHWQKPSVDYVLRRCVYYRGACLLQMGLFTRCTCIFQLCSPLYLWQPCVLYLCLHSPNLFLQRRRCWQKQGPGWLTHRARKPRGRLGRSRWRKRGGWHHCRRGESYGQLALRELCLEVVKGKGRVIAGLPVSEGMGGQLWLERPFILVGIV